MTLLNIFQRAVTEFGQNGVGYMRENGDVVRQTYSQLWFAARKLLYSYGKLGLEPGDKLILALGKKEEFIPAFWGCILGGIVPVPLAPPTSLKTPGANRHKLASIAQTLNYPFVLLDGKLIRGIAAIEIPPEKLLSFNHLQNGNSADVELHTPSSSDLALIQFSSGSTGEPKGVCLTHQNIITNLAAIAEGMELNQEDIFDSWLPLHHDMGLIGFHLVPLYGGINQLQININSFIKYPLLWLESLEKEKATVTAAPNFSQALVLERLKRVPAQQYSLGSVRLLYNGAEPIGVDLMERFIRKMTDFGLKEQAMFPVYGLAEATLAVTFPPLEEKIQIDTLSRVALQTSQQAVTGKEGEEVLRFVSVGKPLKGTEIRIVDREDRLLEEGYVGEIQIRGTNVTQGYYNKENVFCGTWLPAGDLGYTKKGYLYVTGRSKDVIFVHGQNFYAHDLENIASSVPGVKLGRVALWGSFDEVLTRDKVLLFLPYRKLDKEVAELFCQVQQRLSKVVGLNVDEMIPIKSFPKTSSGKLQRYKLGLLYEQGEFGQVIAALGPLLEGVKAQRPTKIPPKTQTEKLLHRVWCEELNLPPEAVGIGDTFTQTWVELGGNSLRMASMTNKLSQQYQVIIDSNMWNEYPTIAALARYLDKRGSRRGKRSVFKG